MAFEINSIQQKIDITVAKNTDMKNDVFLISVFSELIKLFKENSIPISQHCYNKATQSELF